MEIAIIIAVAALAAIAYFAINAKSGNKEQPNTDESVGRITTPKAELPEQVDNAVKTAVPTETVVLIEEEIKPVFAEPEPPAKGTVEAKLLALRKVPIIPTRPINKEAFSVLRLIEDEASRVSNSARVLSEVSMGSFLKANDKEDKTANKEAYYTFGAKRVDFLVIDSSGNPCFVVEYHGSGHFLGDDAPERDLIKREVLRHAGIDLVEIHKQMGQDERKALIAGALHRMTVLK